MKKMNSNNCFSVNGFRINDLILLRKGMSSFDFENEGLINQDSTFNLSIIIFLILQLDRGPLPSTIN